MSAQHTPGPWRVDSHFNIFYKDAMVAFPCISGGLDQKANAQLIAAAPELLEALQQIQRMGYSDIGDRMMVDAAIAKATGEQA
jgi:hypothetical protein